MATIKFNDFAERYCGTNDRAEQIEELLDSLLYNVGFFVGVSEISEEELSELFDTECQIEQTYFEPNGYYDITINGKYYCMSMIKII